MSKKSCWIPLWLLVSMLVFSLASPLEPSAYANGLTVLQHAADEKQNAAITGEQGKASGQGELFLASEPSSPDHPAIKEVKKTVVNGIVTKEIEIEYPEDAKMKLYKIKDDNWKEYNETIILSFDPNQEADSLVIAAKAVDPAGNETISVLDANPKAPVLTLTPTQVEKGNDLTLTWTTAPVYSSYEVWIGTSSAKSDIFKKNVGFISKYAFNTFDLAPGTTAYATVVGHFDGDYKRSVSQPFTVIASSDTQPPKAPTVSATSISDNAITIKWTASTDNVGLKEYLVYKNDVQVGTALSPTTTTYTFRGLTPATSYTFYVKAVDKAGNTSKSNILSVKTTGVDTVPPSIPVVKTLSKTHNSVTLSYSATDNVGVVGYRISRTLNGKYEHFTTETTHTISNLNPDSYYYFIVTAYDAENNSTNSSIHGVKTNPQPTDTEPPTAPTLSVTAKTDKSVSLAWTASTDNTGVVGYDLYVNGVYHSTTTNRTSVVSGLSPNTSYRFAVHAKDAVGNTTSSNIVTVTTNPLQVTLSLSSTKIVEAEANDGSFTAQQIVTLKGSTFVADLSGGVSVANLPPGLTISVTRINDTQMAISFLGKATNHANKDDVTNASVRILASKINGATTTATSGMFAFDFLDPAASLVLTPTVIRESAQNDGSITETLSVVLEHGTFAADLSSGVSITNLPPGLSIAVTRNSDTRLTIAFSGKALHHANQNDVTHATVRISKNLIIGAASDVVSSPFAFDFFDSVGVYTYEYDDLNRLVRIKKDGVDLYEFTYDKNGNVKSKVKK